MAVKSLGNENDWLAVARSAQGRVSTVWEDGALMDSRKVDSREALSQPGDFFIEQTRPDSPTKFDFYYICPCGCTGRHQFSTGSPFELIYVATGEKISSHWQWDGNTDRPTLSPSIHSVKERGGCGWHGYLRAGVWESV